MTGWRSRLGSAWQLVRTMAGERAYEEYLAHRARLHPGAPVLAERDFWRDRMDRRDLRPESRCC